MQVRSAPDFADGPGADMRRRDFLAVMSGAAVTCRRRSARARRELPKSTHAAGRPTMAWFWFNTISLPSTILSFLRARCVALHQAYAESSKASGTRAKER